VGQAEHPARSLSKTFHARQGKPPTNEKKKERRPHLAAVLPGL
jgi:hypothetical protein